MLQLQENVLVATVFHCVLRRLSSNKRRRVHPAQATTFIPQIFAGVVPMRIRKHAVLLHADHVTCLTQNIQSPKPEMQDAEKVFTAKPRNPKPEPPKPDKCHI